MCDYSGMTNGSERHITPLRITEITRGYSPARHETDHLYDCVECLGAFRERLQQTIDHRDPSRQPAND